MLYGIRAKFFDHTTGKPGGEWFLMETGTDKAYLWNFVNHYNKGLMFADMHLEKRKPTSEKTIHSFEVMQYGQVKGLLEIFIVER